MGENDYKISGKKRMRKYFEQGASAFVVIVVSIICFFVLFKIRSIISIVRATVKVLEPVLFALIIAYILNPVEKFFQTRILDRLTKSTGTAGAKEHKRAKHLAVFLSVSILIAVIYVLFSMMIPQLYKSVAKLIEDFPKQFDNSINQINSYMVTHTDKEFVENTVNRAYEYMDGWAREELPPRLNGIIAYIASGIRGVFGTLFNLGVGIIISVYVLNTKDLLVGQSKKVIYAFFSNKTANAIIEGARKSNEIFSRFLTGKLLGALIIGAICFVFMTFMGMPYSMLISVIIGITNIIPFFGPIIGSVISAFLILLISPVKCIYFILFVMVLQAIDANIIEPRLLGQSTGLSSFWVVFAILAGSALFGFAGLFFGVPVFAVIYHFLKNLTEQKLARKNLPGRTDAFVNLDKVSQSGIVKYFDDNHITDKKHREDNGGKTRK